MESDARSSNHTSSSGKGEIDLLFGSDGDMVDNDSFKALSEQDKYSTAVSRPVGSRAIVLNSQKPITKDPIVREAFNLRLTNK